MSRYVEIADSQICIALSPDEWAVALDALNRVQVDRGNPYSPNNRSALTRAITKLDNASEQLRAMRERAC